MFQPSDISEVLQRLEGIFMTPASSLNQKEMLLQFEKFADLKFEELFKKLKKSQNVVEQIGSCSVIEESPENEIFEEIKYLLQKVLIEKKEVPSPSLKSKNRLVLPFLNSVSIFLNIISNILVYDRSVEEIGDHLQE